MDKKRRHHWWLKLYAKLRNNPLWYSESMSLQGAMADIMLRCCHDTYNTRNGVKVVPGKCYTSKRHLSQDWKVCWRTASRIVDKLAAANFIKITPVKNGLLVALVNWKHYQSVLESEVDSCDLETQLVVTPEHNCQKTDEKSCDSRSQQGCDFGEYSRKNKLHNKESNSNGPSAIFSNSEQQIDWNDTNFYND